MLEKNPWMGARVVALGSKTASQVCSLEFLRARLPPLAWAPAYSPDHLAGDLIAGVTTALTVIPQGIGYAPLAGLPLQYGLYASLVPGFTYCLLGTTSQITIGPTAVNALMSYNYAGGSPYKAVTLAFFAGLIEILCGLFNLGFLIQYISQPVIVAFSNAVSIQVITSQVKGFLGITGIQGRGFVNTWKGVFSNLDGIQWYDAGIGIICLVLLYFLRRMKEFSWCEGPAPESAWSRRGRKTKWLLGISANCLVVVGTSLLAWALVSHGLDLLTLTGAVDPGLPAWQLPWTFNRNASDQQDWEGPVEVADQLGVGLVMLPLVSILQHLAIAKHYAGQGGVAASQEILALGVSQLVGSFAGSMPVTASFGRSAVNNSSGVKTPLGGVFTGLIILLACAFLSPFLAFIPTAALSAVIIFAMVFTINFAINRELWQSKKIDLVPYTLTFLLGLAWSVEMGLILGSLAHLCLLLHSQARPAVLAQRQGSVTVISPQGDLAFPALEHLRTQLAQAGGEHRPVVLDLGLVRSIDYTAARGLCSAVRGARERGEVVEVCCAREEVVATLRPLYGEGLGIRDSVGEAVSANSMA